MCGYCIEGEAITLLQKSHFNFNKTLKLAETDFPEALVAAHILPEFGDDTTVSSCQLRKVQHNESISLWALLHQTLFGEDSIAPEIHVDMQAAFDNRVMSEESDKYPSIFIHSLPAFSKLLSSSSLNQLAELYQRLLPELTLESKALFREASRDFFCAYFVKSDEDSPLPNMMLPSFEEEEHEAFQFLPITMMLAADILIQEEPDGVEINAAALHIYPTPGFDSIMMAWQRKIVWHWYSQNGEQGLTNLGLTMRRELILYLAVKSKSRNESLTCFPAVASSMLSPVVNICEKELTQYISALAGK